MTNNETKRITVAKGNGIGPEIMDATLSIMKAAGVEVEYDEIIIGEEIYKQGISAGIRSEDWETLRRNKVFLKAPITTPQGKGFKSLNVTVRKSMGLYANIRPCRSYMPFVKSNFPEMDMVIFRENEEDLYAGIEHQQTAEVVQCLKLITLPGSEILIRHAFEYARQNGRKKVTCMTKDNIMKLTDGAFHQMFSQIAEEYTDIESDHMIIDIGSARIASRPGDFDVIVTPNLYGDIISDIAADVAGSVGLIGTSNIGESFAMFEAIHGSAPDIAGQGIANPTGLINAACLLLVHIGMGDKAALIENALLKTLEDGIHTGDIYNESTSKQKVGTQTFADAVSERLGQIPEQLKPSSLSNDAEPIRLKRRPRKAEAKELHGVDVFLDWDGADRDPQVLGKILRGLSGENLKIKMITNRGVKVFPDGLPETFCTDHWRCRFVSLASTFNPEREGMSHAEPIKYADVIYLLEKINNADLDIIKTENLYSIDEKRAYSLGQGE